MNFPTQIGTDREGYIINYTSKDKIGLNYLLILEELIQLLKQDLNDKLHSIYIYMEVLVEVKPFGENQILIYQ